MSYQSEQDPDCYQGTTVLRNKLGIRDQDHLDRIEFGFYLIQTLQPLPQGDFSFKHYCKLHYHLFADVYEWAGAIRKIRTSKNGSPFCYPEYIECEAEKLFETVNSEQLLNPKSQPEFAQALAKFLSVLNIVHPFREGNGRTQLSFAAMLANRAGFALFADEFDPKDTLNAMILSYRGDNAALQSLIQANITPLS